MVNDVDPGDAEEQPDDVVAASAGVATPKGVAPSAMSATAVAATRTLTKPAGRIRERPSMRSSFDWRFSDFIICNQVA
jgi:hypothetical protein